MFIVSLIVLGLHIYGNYEINKNQELIKNTLEKTYVKVVSPNFYLEYGLSEKEIEEREKSGGEKDKEGAMPT